MPPLFGGYVGPVDEALYILDAAPFFEVAAKRSQHSRQGSFLHPSLKAAMARLVRRVPRGQICPGRARAKDPKHAVEHIACASPRSSAITSWPAALCCWNERFDRKPLLVRQLHRNGRSKNGSAVDPCEEAISPRLL